MVGRVKESLQTDGGQSVEYTLADYHDENAQFLIIHYKGVVSFFSLFFLLNINDWMHLTG